MSLCHFVAKKPYQRILVDNMTESSHCIVTDGHRPPGGGHIATDLEGGRTYMRTISHPPKAWSVWVTFIPAIFHPNGMDNNTPPTREIR